jgi:hypothetical protein
MGTITVLNPIARTAVASEIEQHGLGNLAGVRIAVLDNTKPNAVEVMTAIAAALVRDHGARSYDVYRKLSAAQGASVAQYDEIAANYDLVITGSGDCGGCTSWSALDAIELERRGVSVVLLVTEPFVPLATTLVEREGAPGLPMATIAHPIGGRPAAAMAAIGEAVVPSVVTMLAAGDSGSVESVSVGSGMAELAAMVEGAAS